MPFLALATMTVARAASEQPGTSDLPTISVTSTAAAQPLAHAMHSVTVLDEQQIRQSPVTNLKQFLSTINGVTVRSRGAPGVQADISIRGGSFKQTQILVDGVPVQSPETAHLNADVAIPLSAIKRIEVVKGPGAIGYGGSGNGGIINIITRRADGPQAGGGIAAGSYATRQLHAYIGTGSKNFSSLLTVYGSHNNSEKTSQPTDANIYQALYTGDARVRGLHLKWGMNAAHKNFGAWGFYSDVFPDAREKTNSQMAWVNAWLHPKKWTLHARTYWTRGTDHFLTVIGNNGFLNRHQTHARGFEADAQHEDELGTTVVGAKFRHESIDSSALGGHHRHQIAGWIFRHQRLTKRLSAELGVNRVDYSRDKSHWLPSVSLAWRFNDHWRAYASWAKSARVPTYTELYIDTPANQGNPNLGVEKSQSGEIGAVGLFKKQQLDVSIYRRRTSDFIDFTRQPGQQAFSAENLHGFYAIGGAINWRWFPGWKWLEEVRLGYNRTHLHLGAGSAKNSTHFPFQTFRADLRVPLQHHLHLAVDARRPSYSGQGDATLIGMRLAWRYKSWNLYLQGSNLLGKRIIEAGFGPISGRWFMTGVDVDF